MYALKCSRVCCNRISPKASRLWPKRGSERVTKLRGASIAIGALVLKKAHDPLSKLSKVGGLLDELLSHHLMKPSV